MSIESSLDGRSGRPVPGEHAEYAEDDIARVASTSLHFLAVTQ